MPLTAPCPCGHPWERHRVKSLNGANELDIWCEECKEVLRIEGDTIPKDSGNYHMLKFTRIGGFVKRFL